MRNTSKVLARVAWFFERVRALAWTADRMVPAGFESHCGKLFASELWQFRLPCFAKLVSFGGDTKSHQSLLSGVYARGSKRSHQSALECVTVVDSTLPTLNSSRSASMRRKMLPCTEVEEGLVYIVNACHDTECSNHIHASFSVQKAGQVQYSQSVLVAPVPKVWYQPCRSSLCIFQLGNIYLQMRTPDAVRVVHVRSH